MKKIIEKKLNLSFSKEELNNSNIKAVIRELINLKLNLQRFKPYLSISPVEFEIISKLGDFVDKSKYNNQTEFKGEAGKIKGRRVVIE
jgi:hypothetical protein